ncbi:MAG: hypothetical protein K0B06_12930 [Brevefilum sp.]|nr:hypothetical protein [Brevefilum sp.]
MDDGLVAPDFGAGLSLDEMVGMMAWEISQAVLPTGEVYQAVNQAAGAMVADGLDAYMLMEVWADGHTLWHGMRRDDPVVVTPAGALIRTR